MPSHALYIPFDYYQDLSGPATFLQNLRQFFDKSGISTAVSPQDARVMFFPMSYSLKVLEEFQRTGGYIVQRLDGIYYPSKHGDAYRKYNAPMETVYHDYADFVIFQSQYSRAQCVAMFGESAPSRIVVNGADHAIFYPGPQTRLRDRTINFVTTGYFRNPDMIEPVVAALDSLAGQFPFELTAIGPLLTPELEHFFQRPYLRYVKSSLPLVEIADILRQSDIFLYSHLNPPCPNSVIEAVSCGLPVVGFDSGAMAELCFFAKELLAPVSDEVFQKYADFDVRKLAEKITLAVERYDHYRSIALAHSALYSFDACGREYWEVFATYLNKPRKMRPYATYLVKERVGAMRRRVHALKSRLFERLGYSPEALFTRILANMPAGQFTSSLAAAIQQRTAELPPAKALKLLFELENRLYSLEGEEAIRYGNGLHTKHRHIKYHDFFVERIAPGSRVLDVGCGNGALAHDIATQVEGVSVFGIDLAPQNIVIAQQQYAADNIRFVCGNALHDLPDQPFDVIVLSNVLEHLEQRVEFLQTLQQRYRPTQFLIRVPVFERDWRVPLKAELGVDYRLDPTHCTEYRQGEFEAELAQAGLHIMHAQVNWGEIWAEIRP